MLRIIGSVLSSSHLAPGHPFPYHFQLMTLGRTKKKHIFEVWPKKPRTEKNFNFQLNLCKDADLIASVAVIELAVPGPSVCVAWRVPWRWPRPLCCGGPSKAVLFFSQGKNVTNHWPIFFLSSNCWRKTKKFQKHQTLHSLQHFSGMQSFEFHKVSLSPPHPSTWPRVPEPWKWPSVNRPSEHRGRPFNGMLCEVNRQVCSYKIQASNRSLERDPSIIDIEIQWIPLQT